MLETVIQRKRGMTATLCTSGIKGGRAVEAAERGMLAEVVVCKGGPITLLASACIHAACVLL
jgi:hypothetical protein